MPTDKQKFKELIDELILEIVDDSLAKIRASLLDKQLDPAMKEFNELVIDLKAFKNTFIRVDKPK